MSFDDAIQSEGDPEPKVCDKCQDMLENTIPDPILGWPLLVFDCARCKLQFCEHLESAEPLVCLSCNPKSTSPEGK